MDPEVSKKVNIVNKWLSSLNDAENVDNIVANSAYINTLDSYSSNSLAADSSSGSANSTYSTTSTDTDVDLSNYGNAPNTPTWTWYPNNIGTGIGGVNTFTPYIGESNELAKEKTMSEEDLKDLLSEIKDKDEECDNKIDKLFEQMKEDKSKTAMISPMFQYYVGMKEGLDILIRKIKKYLKTDED